MTVYCLYFPGFQVSNLGVLHPVNCYGYIRANQASKYARTVTVYSVCCPGFQVCPLPGVPAASFGEVPAEGRAEGGVCAGLHPQADEHHV